MRRRRGPGLIGVAARTAVVAGTATAVSGKVARNQQEKAMASQAQAAQAEAEMEARIQAEVNAQMAAQAPAPAPAAAPAGGDDTMAKLQQYATMKQQGLLTDEEFAALKAKLLGI